MVMEDVEASIVVVGCGDDDDDDDDDVDASRDGSLSVGVFYGLYRSVVCRVCDLNTRE